MTTYIKYEDIQIGDSVENEYKGIFTRLTVAERDIDNDLVSAEGKYVVNDGGLWELLDRPSPFIEGSVWYITRDKPTDLLGFTTWNKRLLRAGDRVTVLATGENVKVSSPRFTNPGSTYAYVDPKFLSAEPLDVVVPRALIEGLRNAENNGFGFVGAAKALLAGLDAGKVAA